MLLELDLNMNSMAALEPAVGLLTRLSRLGMGGNGWAGDAVLAALCRENAASARRVTWGGQYDSEGDAAIMAGPLPPAAVTPLGLPLPLRSPMRAPGEPVLTAAGAAAGGVGLGNTPLIDACASRTGTGTYALSYFRQSIDGVRLSALLATLRESDQLRKRLSAAVAGKGAVAEAPGSTTPASPVLRQSLSTNGGAAAHTRLLVGPGTTAEALGALSARALAERVEAAALAGSRFLCLGGLRAGAMPSLPLLPRVTDLDVSGNELRGLPAVVFDMVALRRLCARTNRISAASFPDLPGLPHLASLDLGMNDLRCFPAGLLTLLALRVLDVSCNGLAALPPALAALPCLVHVAAHGNPLPPGVAAALARGVGWRLATQGVEARLPTVVRFDELVAE